MPCFRRDKKILTNCEKYGALFSEQMCSYTRFKQPRKAVTHGQKFHEQWKT
jgi:hypothetical protein